jgi:hypothetical protein
VTPEQWEEDCYLVYALAPDGTDADEANLRVNEFLGDPRRGLPVNHDHFENPHGAVAIFHVRTPEELATLRDPGPLEGWRIAIHKLVFAITAIGWIKQGEFTAQRFHGVDLLRMESDEGTNPRYWWHDGGMAQWVANAERADADLTTRFGPWRAA